MGHLPPGAAQRGSPVEDINALVPSVSIANMINVCEGALQRIEQALRMMVEADEMVTGLGLDSVWLNLVKHMESTKYDRYGGDKRDPVPEVIERLAHSIDGKAWNHLLNASGLRSFMDNASREQWGKALADGQAPAFTPDNIQATFEQLYASRGDMRERGVIEVFKRLSWNYKTNLPSRFGNRIVVRGVASHYRGYGYMSFHTNQLEDLERVFHVYDGRPEPDHRNGVDTMLRAAARDGETQAEDDYLHVRWYMNGNAHVTFKRPDLVDKLNAVLVRHYPGALPPAR
ncbi:MAG: DUF4942 domain-containing protein [Rhodanobacter sp.]|nr:DUF4942 domain-containing protein [Rhodanobacter sp.]